MKAAAPQKSLLRIDQYYLSATCPLCFQPSRPGSLCSSCLDVRDTSLPLSLSFLDIQPLPPFSSLWSLIARISKILWDCSFSAFVSRQIVCKPRNLPVPYVQEESDPLPLPRIFLTWFRMCMISFALHSIVACFMKDWSTSFPWRRLKNSWKQSQWRNRMMFDELIWGNVCSTSLRGNIIPLLCQLLLLLSNAHNDLCGIDGDIPLPSLRLKTWEFSIHLQ